MRLATFAAPVGSEVVEVSLTEFPGDTGGLLANINRWRGQGGLSPTTEAELASLGKQSEAGPVRVYITRITGATSETLGAVLFHTSKNQSRFLKATCTGAQADAVESAFGEFASAIAEQWGRQ